MYSGWTPTRCASCPLSVLWLAFRPSFLSALADKASTSSDFTLYLSDFSSATSFLHPSSLSLNLRWLSYLKPAICRIHSSPLKSIIRISSIDGTILGPVPHPRIKFPRAIPTRCLKIIITALLTKLTIPIPLVGSARVPPASPRMKWYGARMGSCRTTCTHRSTPRGTLKIRINKYL